MSAVGTITVYKIQSLRQMDLLPSFITGLRLVSHIINTIILTNGQLDISSRIENILVIKADISVKTYNLYLNDRY